MRRMYDGVLNIYKEAGFTSHDVVAKPVSYTHLDVYKRQVVSRAFGDKLDEQDFIGDSYILEVSSPGLGRPLKKEKDYERSMGKELEIRTYRAIDRQKEFYGVLHAYDAVSYTHLDVYKRQGVMCGTWYRGIQYTWCKCQRCKSCLLYTSRCV